MSPQTPRANVTASALDVLLDVELPLTVRFGKTQMIFGDVAALRSGSRIPFENAPEDPVDLLINGRVVARGQVVMAGGNYAVRLTEISSRRERMESSSPLPSCEVSD